MVHLKGQAGPALIAEPTFGEIAGAVVLWWSVRPCNGAAREVAGESLVCGAGGFAAGYAETMAHPLGEDGAGVADFGAGAATLKDNWRCHFVMVM